MPHFRLRVFNDSGFAMLSLYTIRQEDDAKTSTDQL